MSSAETLFQRLLKDLRPALAPSGFRRRSQNYICESPECWAVINFQKSQWSTVNEKRFTINLAIAAKRILAYQDLSTDAPPRSFACHWETRIGSLLPDNRDKWWTLSDESSYGAVESEVQNTLSEYAVPILKEHLSERGLLDLWSSKTPGNFELPSLKYKSILLSEQKQFDRLPEIFQRMRDISRGNLAAPGVEDHIAQLRRCFSLPE
jgi:hypothetical protein